MPEEHGALKLKVPTSADYSPGQADVPRAFREFADSVATRFTDTSGKLLIAQPKDVAKFVAMKGDGTIDAEGNFQLGAGVVGTNELANNAASDSKLASPNNGVWRHLAAGETNFNLDRAAGVWALAHGGPIADGANFQGQALTVVHLDTTDYSVSGKTTKVRVAAQFFGNGVTPNTDFRVGLYRIEQASGTADAIMLNIGERVVGPATVESPAALAFLSKTSPEVTLASGSYIFAVETTATLANNAAVHVSAQLQMRHV